MSVGAVGSQSSSASANQLSQKLRQFKSGGAKLSKDDITALEQELKARGKTQPPGAPDLLANYDKIDVDGDGISRDELQAYNQSIGYKPPQGAGLFGGGGIGGAKGHHRHRHHIPTATDAAPTPVSDPSESGDPTSAAALLGNWASDNDSDGDANTGGQASSALRKAILRSYGASTSDPATSAALSSVA